jgi:uncharacterized protein (TIGR03435 family)
LGSALRQRVDRLTYAVSNTLLARLRGKRTARISRMRDVLHTRRTTPGRNDVAGESNQEHPSSKEARAASIRRELQAIFARFPSRKCPENGDLSHFAWNMTPLRAKTLDRENGGAVKVRLLGRLIYAAMLRLMCHSGRVETPFFCLAAFAVLLVVHQVPAAQIPIISQAATPISLLPMPSNADPIFEVATIKPSDTSSPHGTFLTSRGRHSIAYNFTVIDLISFAYGVHVRQIVGGPAPLLQMHFDIDGLPDIEGHPSLDQSKLMYRKLLASRFKLALHHASRDLPAFALVLAKGGPKLAKTERKPGDSTNFSYTHQIVLTVRNASMSDFAHGMQETFLDRPVIDQTGLKDRFDFDLKWTPDEAQSGGQPPVLSGGNSEDQPGLYTAIQEQLGLKIVPTKSPVEVLVIDHLEPPSAN